MVQMDDPTLTPTEPPPMAEVFPKEEIYAKYGRLVEKYDLLVKQTASILGVLAKLKSGELKIEEIDLKAGSKEE